LILRKIGLTELAKLESKLESIIIPRTSWWETHGAHVSNFTSHITAKNKEAQARASHFYNKIEMGIGYARLPFLLKKIKKIGFDLGANDAVHPDGHPCASHRHVTMPHAALRQSPERHHLMPLLRKSLKKTVREVVHIVHVGGEGEESSRYLEAGKGGECSWPLLPTR
jgi:hypothetical protein